MELQNDEAIKKQKLMKAAEMADKRRKQQLDIRAPKLNIPKKEERPSTATAPAKPLIIDTQPKQQQKTATVLVVQPASPQNSQTQPVSPGKIVIKSKRSASEDSLEQQGASASVVPQSARNPISAVSEKPPSPKQELAPVYDPTKEPEQAADKTKEETKKDIPDELKALDGLSRADFVLRSALVGHKLQCKIVRAKDNMEKSWYPYYEVYLEHPQHGDVFLMSARKRKKSTSANYVISTVKLHSKIKEDVVGKVRSNFIGTSFTIYDNGRNPFKEKGTKSSKPVRKELAAVFYEPNLLGLNGPRKMTVMLPAIAKDGKPVQFQPIRESETILEKHKEGITKELVILHNKSPQWNEETQSYVLNFSGRVTMASVKNFQIVHDNDSKLQ